MITTFNTGFFFFYIKIPFHTGINYRNNRQPYSSIIRSKGEIFLDALGSNVMDLMNFLLRWSVNKFTGYAD